MTKKIKKGFTLTELIVVIAIIAILAAVLIPTSISFIQKAKQSADLQEVTSMNKILSSNAIIDDVSYYSADDIEYMLCEENQYTLRPKSKGYSFWYNRATNCIELIENKSLGDDIFAEEETKYPVQVEQIHPTDPKYLYVDKKNNDVSNAIDTIKNLVEKAESEGALGLTFENAINSVQNTIIRAHLEKYHPNTTLYIDKDGFFTNANSDGYVLSVNNVVFTSRTKVIPACNLTNHSISIVSGLLELPKRLTEITNGALLKLSANVVIGVNDSNKKLVNEKTVNKYCSIIETSNDKIIYNIGISYKSYVKVANPILANIKTYYEPTFVLTNDEYKFITKDYYIKDETNIYTLEVNPGSDGVYEIQDYVITTDETIQGDQYYTYEEFECTSDYVMSLKEDVQFDIDFSSVAKFSDGSNYQYEVKSYTDSEGVSVFEVIIYYTEGLTRGSIFARGIVRYLTHK